MAKKTQDVQFTLHDLFEFKRNQQTELNNMKQGRWHELYDMKIMELMKKIEEPFKIRGGVLLFFILTVAVSFYFTTYNNNELSESLVYGFFIASAIMLVLSILGRIEKHFVDISRKKKCVKKNTAKEKAEKLFIIKQEEEFEKVKAQKIEPQIDELIDTNFGSPKRNENKEEIISFVFHEISNIIKNIDRASHIRSFCADINVEVNENGAYIHDINNSYNKKQLLYNTIHMVPFYDIERISLTRTLTSRIQTALAANYPEGKFKLTFDLYEQEYTTNIKITYEETNPDFQCVGVS